MGDFQNIEAKFCFDMREGVILVRYAVTIFLLKLGIEKGHGTVGCNGMTCEICGIVGECAKSKSIIIQLVRFPRVAEERKNKIAASYIVGEIAEKDASMRVIAQVLNDRAALAYPCAWRSSSGVACGKRWSRTGLMLVSQAESIMAS